jgi:hypothetical protein
VEPNPTIPRWTADDYRWLKEREEALRAKYGDGDGVDWTPEGQAYYELQHGRELLPDHRSE